MTIRKATTNDVDSIAPILLLVLEKIVYTFIGENDYTKAKEFLIYFLNRGNNQYSYQNCYVAERDDEIIGVANLYNGSDLEQLRQPVLEYIDQHYATDLHIEDETQKGEYYIDTIAVKSNEQGNGVGSQMLQHLINEYMANKKQTLGLLVNENNPNAKKLYLKMGFASVGKKKLLGHQLDHLQIKGEHLIINQ
ncbi:GNAT family N-acetyltransferase [Sediminicola arcticus]|jgi:ribosomal protein S18 acetylase RimI-like enzyme|uniref:GNAT family N-acetyltransferase n=1 Tax=Sediminicola arcticus TaxID=1574308 RepID=A0ABV2SWP5_9FLAO